MDYRIAPLSPTPAKLSGLSERLIASHYENNYGGAVRRLNAITRELAQLDFASAPGFLLNGLKREELIAANSMLLHEIYFDGLGGGAGPEGELAAALEHDFGSFARWEIEFASMGKALGGGSGWVLLTWLPRDGRLINQWASDHTHTLAGGQPILALDMYEHAYHLDFGARAGAYVDTYLKNINWEWAAQRYLNITAGGPPPRAHHGEGSIRTETMIAAVAEGRAPRILDVRRRPAFDAGIDMIPGAEWRAPEEVDEWAGTLPAGEEIVVYCVYGHNVSDDTARALRKKGLNARPLAGGIAAWHAIGGETELKK